MTSKRFLYLALISIAIILGGCTTIQIPAEIKTEMSSTQPIIGYFSRSDDVRIKNCGCRSWLDPQYSPTPVENGYYRLLLGRNAEGLFLIQDFYQKNKQPQSSPLWIDDPTYLFSFDSRVVIGSGILYYPDGTVVERFENTDINTSKGEGFYKNGQRAVTYKQDARTSTFEYWYLSGKFAARYINSFDAAPRAEAWDEQGNKVQDADAVIARIEAKLNTELDK